MVTLSDARAIIAAAEAKAQEIGQPMNIAVVDAGGNLIAHVRMDGAWLGSIDISIKKAFTSRAFDIATHDLAKEAQPGKQFYGIQESNGGRIMIFAGGIPLKRDGKVVGAIGVSGGAGAQDQSVAEAGWPLSTSRIRKVTHGEQSRRRLHSGPATWRSRASTIPSSRWATASASTASSSRLIATNICGSDQHMVRGRTTAPRGLVLGHEITGEVIECGRDVEFIKVGDLISVPFNVACGRCRNCKERHTGLCLNVNPRRPGGAYGYVDMGGWIGGQAEYVMVPYADWNAAEVSRQGPGAREDAGPDLPERYPADRLSRLRTQPA